jgi:RNA polymerase sigma factor (sigma-70 family)
VAKERVERDEEDLVRLYLTDIGQYPLLTKEDEVRLAQAIEAGVEARTELEAGGTIPAARKRELRKLSRAGEDAEQTFVQSNLRLVVSIAKKYQASGLPLLDLIQEGNLGLIKSVHRFDDRRGFRFSTYAHWWIRQAIERAIMNKGAQVRLPVHIFDARREIAKASHDLAQMLGRDPSKDELAEALGQPIDKIEEILKAVPREPVSLDDPVGDDEDRTVSETICDQDDATPDEKVISVDQASHVRHILRRLSPMEIDIIERRFGLVNDGNETLEEIGKSYNLSRERVRQIQVQGLKKMMRFCERRQLAV